MSTFAPVVESLLENKFCPSCESDGQMERCSHCGEFYCLECMKDHVKFILEAQR